MKKTIEEIEKNQCTGCGLCAEKCPKGCILMIEDREGFRFPQIDSSKCIQCGICFSKCPTTSIAEFLKIDQSKVVEVTKNGLKVYKEKLIKTIDNIAVADTTKVYEKK